MDIKEKQMFECPKCGKFFKKKGNAVNCFKKCEQYEIALQEKRKAEEEQKVAKEKELAEKERIANAPRLEAESLEHLIELIKYYAKEHYDLDVEFVRYPKTFGDLRPSYKKPINEQGSNKLYKGWTGQWIGNIKGEKIDCGYGYKESPDLSYLFKCFKGFHYGTGCPGSEFRIIGELFLDDFPKIKEKFDKYYKLSKEKTDINNKKVKLKLEIENDTINRFKKTQRAVNLQNKLDELVETKKQIETMIEENSVTLNQMQNKEINSAISSIFETEMGKELFFLEEKFDKETYEKHKKIFGRI